jgi:hypothetical protein
MAKAKLKATLTVADGAGGLITVADRRFEPGAWPIQFDVPKECADTWFQYLGAECDGRGWGRSGIGQLERRENSGSLTIHTGLAGLPQIDVVWERKKGGPLKIRSRSAGAHGPPIPQLRELFDRVNQRAQAGITERIYRRGQLHFDGLAWRGELWLDDTLRLGPPTRQDETALVGPRIILVDALVECIGPSDAPSAFHRKLRELAAFLSVVAGHNVQMPPQERAWTYSEGPSDCAVRQLGYIDPDSAQEMPRRGTHRAVPMRAVSRPDFSRRGIDGSTDECSVPSDITDLWSNYCALPPDRRRQFHQAAAKWQQALTHWGDQSTLSFALMVVACEALKPPDAQFNDHNIYHVVEALLGKPVADQLHEDRFRPQEVRNAHLHAGEFRGSEFMHIMTMSSYQDPTFRQACDELAKITPAALIEWLRRGGRFTMPVRPRRKTWRHRVKENFLAVLGIAASAAFVAGLIAGWLL